jgi:hypothetical protein
MPAAKKTTARLRGTAADPAARGSAGARGAATAATARGAGAPATTAARGRAAAPAAAALSLAQRRISRKHVLDALHQETGSNGGDHAAPRVTAFRADPNGAGREHFTFCGALPLVRWYVDPARPTAGQARSLWQEVRKRLGKAVGTAPAGIDGDMAVVGLQTLAEQAP